MSMTIDLVPVVAALNRLGNWDKRLWLAQVGEHNEEVIRRRITKTKLDPSGEPWPPWRESTKRKREHKGNAAQGLLWDDGHLLQSIHSAVAASGATVTTGSEVRYDGFLQDGTRRMEKRPFVGWGEEDLAWVEGSLVAHLNALTL